MTKRAETPNRYREVRKDASVKSAEKAAEKALGLPPGSVKIVNPDGSDTRSDAKVGTLRKKYDK